MSGSGAAEISGREGLPAGSAEEQHDSQNGAVGLDVSVKQEKKPSPRMENSGHIMRSSDRRGR